MTDFKRGDKIRITHPDTKASKTIWLAEENGELFTYHPFDYMAPETPLDDLLASPFIVSLETAFEDALPTVPGEYEDRVREEGKLALLSEVADYEFDEDTLKPWTLNEDGTWTAPNGESRPITDNWYLAVNGFDFFPWEERAVK